MNTAIKNIAKDMKKAEDNAEVDNILNSNIDMPSTSTELVVGMTPEKLQEFKADVKQWIEIDTTVKRLQVAIKERKKLQMELNARILNFMIANNIEDLNTKSGLIKCKTSVVKVPMGAKVIKEKLEKTFENNQKVIDKINEVYDNRETVEKHSLKKMKF